jgi:copper chaperone NosL
MTTRILDFAPLVVAHGRAPKSPEPIAYGDDACAYCRRTICDDRFSAVIVSCDTGCSVKFDTVDCLLAYCRRADQAHDVGAVWVADFRGQGDMLDANSARFVRLGFGRTAVGCGWAAVATARDAAAIGVIDIARIKRWSELQ